MPRLLFLILFPKRPFSEKTAVLGHFISSTISQQSYSGRHAFPINLIGILKNTLGSFSKRPVYNTPRRERRDVFVAISTINQRRLSHVCSLSSYDETIWRTTSRLADFHLIREERNLFSQTRRHLPPLFLSFSSSCFFNSSMSFLSLAFSAVSFFSSRALAWTTVFIVDSCQSHTGLDNCIHIRLLSES